MNAALHNLKMLQVFFLRDWAIFTRRFRMQLLNYVVLSPCTMIFCYGYIQPHVSFSAEQPELMLLMFVGVIIYVMFPLAYTLHLDMFLDLQHDKFTGYLMTLANPRILFFEKMLFIGVVTFLCMVPFYPVARFILSEQFAAADVAWGQLAVVLFFGAMLCSAYNLWMMSALKGMNKIANFWLRVNYPLMQLAGVLVTWEVMAKVSPLLGWALCLNPLLYINEGLRGAILPGSSQFSFLTCCAAMITCSVLFAALSFRLFKKRLDHI